jgi:sigma-E factor negative regulatory protein RseB
MRGSTLVTLLLGGCLSVPAFAASDASQWLNRLAQAEQQQSYQGTFVYERSGSFSTHDIWHRAQGSKVSERLLQLDGSAQEVTRVNGQTQCVSGALVPGVSVAPATSPRPLDPLKLMSWYDLSVAGESRVAGRKATIVTMTPKDQYRYGFELHLDSETGLLLKSLLLNDKGQLLERFQFTRFDPTSPSDNDLSASKNCNPVAQVAAVKDPSGPINWHSDWLPPGFELANSAVRKDPDSKSTVSSLMYDDGLARFSVFLEPLNGAKATDARTQLGPTAAVSRRLSTPKGDVMVTVVGEIPIGTAERIALSMRPLDPQAKQ